MSLCGCEKSDNFSTSEIDKFIIEFSDCINYESMNNEIYSLSRNIINGKGDSIDINLIYDFASMLDAYEDNKNECIKNNIEYISIIKKYDLLNTCYFGAISSLNGYLEFNIKNNLDYFEVRIIDEMLNDIYTCMD